MTVKAEWSDETDERVCLCCGQLAVSPPRRSTPAEFEHEWRILDGLGYTRESLLTKHRAQIDYQSPGFAQWLQGQ
jgi:hypothetical protein